VSVTFRGVYKEPTETEGGIYVGPNPPLDPEEGDMWYNNETDELFIYD